MDDESRTDTPLIPGAEEEVVALNRVTSLVKYWPLVLGLIGISYTVGYLSVSVFSYGVGVLHVLPTRETMIGSGIPVLLMILLIVAGRVLVLRGERSEDFFPIFYGIFLSILICILMVFLGPILFRSSVEYMYVSEMILFCVICFIEFYALAIIKVFGWIRQRIKALCAKKAFTYQYEKPSYQYFFTPALVASFVIIFQKYSTNVLPGFQPMLTGFILKRADLYIDNKVIHVVVVQMNDSDVSYWATNDPMWYRKSKETHPDFVILSRSKLSKIVFNEESK